MPRLTSYIPIGAPHHQCHSRDPGTPLAPCQGMPRLTSYNLISAPHHQCHSRDPGTPLAPCQGMPRLTSYIPIGAHHHRDRAWPRGLRNASAAREKMKEIEPRKEACSHSVGATPGTRPGACVMPMQPEKMSAIKMSVIAPHTLAIYGR
jgi:hypothetical protein